MRRLVTDHKTAVQRRGYGDSDGADRFPLSLLTTLRPEPRHCAGGRRREQPESTADSSLRALSIPRESPPGGEENTREAHTHLCIRGWAASTAGQGTAVLKEAAVVRVHGGRASTGKAEAAQPRMHKLA